MGGNGRNEQFYIQTTGHLLNKQAINGGRGHDTSKAYSRCLFTYVQARTKIISTYKDKAPQKQTFIQNPEKKRAREPLFGLGAWMTEGSQEAGQVTWPSLVTARISSGR